MLRIHKSPTHLLVFIAFGMSAGPAVAAAPAGFDLVCSGSPSSPASNEIPLAMRLSIDVGGKRWCYRDTGCANVYPILAIRDGKLTLLAVKTAFNEASFQVDLKSGVYTRASSNPSRPDQAGSGTGQCQKALFTPIR